MSFRYTVYGLGIESNYPLPGLINLKDDLPVDVRVAFRDPGVPSGASPAGARLFYQSSYRDENGNPALMFQDSAAEPGYARFLYANGAEFIIDEAGKRVCVHRPPAVSAEEAAAYLIGPVLGYVLRLKGEVVLHAGAVVVAGGIVALAGPSHSGKSTLVAAFAHLGYPVFSDDLVALRAVALRPHEGAFLAQPGYPRLKLWPASAAVVRTSADHLLPISAAEDKRFLDLNASRYRFHDSPLPLRAVYVLGARRTDEAPAVGIEPLNEKRALLFLIANSYVNQLLSRELLGFEFDLLAQIARQIPVSVLTSPDDLSGLPEFCGMILDDLGQRPTPLTNQ